MNYYKYTNKGPREKNEDSLYVDVHHNSVFASIADGVGGLPHGEVASNYVIGRFVNNITAENKLSFKELLIKTNKELEKLAKDELNVNFIATTFSGLYANSKKIKGIHIGDSRVILIRDGAIRNLTTDHSELGRLIREKKITQKESKNYIRKNIIEYVLGNTEYFKFMEFDIESKPNDRLIISTDGFHESITDEIILRISNKYKSLKEVHRRLIIEVENRVLRDNTSFICIEI
ncbi:protein phosphatase 2C domain-containing protein [uncultured Draconibacterium sp.]|uniref:PP2C family protein-serine/threonine phosphatase n=1 Tax=uncultured Draconibacterium sp. TaxID=1573823 RepID=UPI0029C06080|nr:protein phosphatase 2C domain-containing protein [uncultured Draconibacterium sp.]MBN2881453.1 serine/threonine-protein phosphatase [Candidatus Woesearchaeota archaeon]